MAFAKATNSCTKAVSRPEKAPTAAPVPNIAPPLSMDRFALVCRNDGLKHRRNIPSCPALFPSVAGSPYTCRSAPARSSSSPNGSRWKCTSRVSDASTKSYSGANRA